MLLSHLRRRRGDLFAMADELERYARALISPKSEIGHFCSGRFCLPCAEMREAKLRSEQT